MFWFLSYFSTGSEPSGKRGKLFNGSRQVSPKAYSAPDNTTDTKMAAHCRWAVFWASEWTSEQINITVVTDWMFVSPPNPYVEVLTPNVMALEGRVFRK